MKTALERLQPVREARERRALRQHHDDSLVHEQALAQQMGAQRAVHRLQASHREARAVALGDGPVRADQAQAALEHAAVLAGRVADAGKRLLVRTQAAGQALEVARRSRQAHARQVRINDMVRQVCDTQAGERERALGAAEESRSDDDYALAWVAQRRSLAHGGS